MEPPDDSQGRRWTGSVDQGSFDGDDPGAPRQRRDSDGSTDDETNSWQFRMGEENDWLDASRRERRRERERRWEQLQLAT